MSAAAFLTGLYPPPIRDRWGSELRREVSAAGFRSWPDTLAGAVRLWLRPGDWPLGTGTRRVLTVTLFALVAAAGLLLRTMAPSPTLTASVQHPATSVWPVPLVAAVVLAAPLPPVRWAALRELLAEAVRVLALPGVAGAVLVTVAWSPWAGRATGVAELALTAYYWLTLGFVALAGCVLIARVARVSRLPSPRRISWALSLLGAGLGLAAVQGFIGVVRTAPHGVAVAQLVGLAVVAAVAAGAAHDLRAKA
ncbi:MAG TPA: hypothetical protein VHC49_25550 [Mycobacteriales bacterium]|nr:hypothetical protein [Mycobacteriales bacterium]